MKHTVGKSANLYPSFKDDPWTIRLWQHKLATTCASLGNDCTQQQKRHTHSVRAALAPVYMDCWQQSMCVSIKHNTASRQILCCKKIARIVKLPYQLEVQKQAVLSSEKCVCSQSVTFVLMSIQTNIRIYSYEEKDTNEYPNMFV